MKTQKQNLTDDVTNKMGHPLGEYKPEFKRPPMKGSAGFEAIDRHTWSMNINADEFEAIEATERLLSDIIEMANISDHLIVRQNDFLYSIVGEKRDQLRRLLSGEEPI